MEFCVQWVTSDPEKEFWDFFDEDPGLPKELLVRYFRSPGEPCNSEKACVYYALLRIKKEPAAGCIFIYFPQSRSLLIRHMFIKEAFRKDFDLDGLDPSYDKLKHLFSKKRGQSTGQDGLSYLLEQIRATTVMGKTSPIYVFGETVNVLHAPSLSLKEHQRFNKLHRFYATIKGKTFETTAYDRPRIGNEFGGQPLCLLNFPEFHEQPFVVSIPVVLSFVEEYQQFVATQGESNEPITNWAELSFPEPVTGGENRVTSDQLSYLNLSNEYLKNFLLGLLSERYGGNKPYIYLRELPRLEEPKIGFNRASVCFELMVDEDYYNPRFIDREQRFPKIVDAVRPTLWWKKIFSGSESPEYEGWDEGTDTGTKKAELEYNKRWSALSREKKIDEILLNGYCVVHHSFETDLLAYKYQSNPPFFTKNYRPGQLITVRFPESSDFISEGRKERFYAATSKPSRDVNMHCFVNYTYFLNSRMRVWHIVLRSSDEYPVSEFDLIRLMKFFGGSQESTSERSKKDNELTKIKFMLGKGEGEMLGFLDFFKAVSGVKYRKRHDTTENQYVLDELSLIKNIKTGIVQVDSKYINTDALISHLESSAPVTNETHTSKRRREGKFNEQVIEKDLRKYHGDIYEQITERSVDDDERNPYESIDYILKTYCGIALGLLDFERMGWQEVGDTLQPRVESLDKAYFLTVNRGVTTSYSLEDNVLGSTWNTLGINPYLVIPSAVLVHNEYVSNDADERLTRVLERCRADSSNGIELGELIEERNYIDDLVNDDILSNVFQYPSEQELYNYGMKHRGIVERINDTKAKLNQLDKIIEQLQSQKSIQNEKWIQLVLGVLSLLQLISVAADHLDIMLLDTQYFIASIPLLVFLYCLGGILFAALFYVNFLRGKKVTINKIKKNGTNKRRA